ncbi:MAG: aromatic ring-hydroxylating dioxygenase subunit alpha [Granulosicoccus sp.]|nr:aromatic ring-hydroxylating dioxygenase subunit alpha [Granulosicoccus sp.]
MTNQEPHAFSALLPAWTYQNPEFLALEVDTLFRANWMLAGHISELADQDSYLTFEGFGERILVLRDQEGRLRAFHNVCRHRGAPLLEGKGGNCPPMLSCPFHGWTYDRGGRCVAIPASSTFSDINIEEKGLVPVDVEVWMGFVFIRITSGGPSLAQQLEPVARIIEPYQIENMIPLPGSAHREIRPYNWKVIHDIDNEGYHVPVGHPSLQQLYGKTYKDSFVEGISVSTAEINSRKAKNWSVARYQTLLP